METLHEERGGSIAGANRRLVIVPWLVSLHRETEGKVTCAQKLLSNRGSGRFKAIRPDE